jgi:hypothetical protein
MGARGIFRADFGAAVEQAVGFVEVDGFGDVGGDELVVFLRLLDAVDLDGEEHGDIFGLQLAGQGDGFRGAPAHAVKDDAGVLFFFGREGAVVVGVQEFADDIVSGFAAAVLEDFDVDVGGVVFAEVVGDLDGAVDGVVVVDEAAYEADDDGGGRGGGEGEEEEKECAWHRFDFRTGWVGRVVAGIFGHGGTEDTEFEEEVEELQSGSF